MVAACLLVLLLLVPGAVVRRLFTDQHPGAAHVNHEAAKAPAGKTSGEPLVSKGDKVCYKGQEAIVKFIDYSSVPPSYFLLKANGGEVNTERDRFSLFPQGEDADCVSGLADPQATLEAMVPPAEGETQAADQAVGRPQDQVAASMEKVLHHKAVASEKYKQIEVALQGKLTQKTLDEIWSAYAVLKEAAIAANEAAGQAVLASEDGADAVAHQAKIAARSAHTLLDAAMHQMSAAASMQEALQHEAFASEKYNQIEAALQGKLTQQTLDEIWAACAVLKEEAIAAKEAAGKAVSASGASTNAVAQQAKIAARSAQTVLEAAMHQMNVVDYMQEAFKHEAVARKTYQEIEVGALQGNRTPEKMSEILAAYSALKKSAAAATNAAKQARNVSGDKANAAARQATLAASSAQTILKGAEAVYHETVAWVKYKEIRTAMQGEITPEKIHEIRAAYSALERALEEVIKAAKQAPHASGSGAVAAPSWPQMHTVHSAQRVLQRATQRVKAVASVEEVLNHEAFAWKKYREMEAVLQRELTPKSINQVQAAYSVLEGVAKAAAEAAKHAINAMRDDSIAAARQAVAAATSAKTVLKGAAALYHEAVAWEKYNGIAAALQGRLTPAKIEEIRAAYSALKKAAHATSEAHKQASDISEGVANAAVKRAALAASTAQRILDGATQKMRVAAHSY